MVRAQHRTNGVGGFAVGMAGVVAALMHGVQNAAVDGFQAVAHVGQSAGHDDRHGVVQKCGLDLLFDIADDLFGSAARYHHIIFFHCFLRRIIPSQSMPYGIASSPEKGELFCVRRKCLSFCLKASPLREDFPRSGTDSPRPGRNVTAGDKRGNLARQRLRGFSYTSSFAYWALVSIKRRRGST